MDDAERCRREQDLLFADLERDRLRHLFAAAEAVGLPVVTLKLLRAMGALSIEDLERRIAEAKASARS
jgi:hypothetical protein